MALRFLNHSSFVYYWLMRICRESVTSMIIICLVSNWFMLSMIFLFRLMILKQYAVHHVAVLQIYLSWYQSRFKSSLSSWKDWWTIILRPTEIWLLGINNNICCFLRGLMTRSLKPWCEQKWAVNSWDVLESGLWCWCACSRWPHGLCLPSWRWRWCLKTMWWWGKRRCKVLLFFATPV